MPRKKKNVPANETPEQRFTRVATERLYVIQKSLKSMSNLKGSRYKSTPVQRETINKVVLEALKKCMESMAGVEVEVTTFKL